MGRTKQQQNASSRPTLLGGDSITVHTYSDFRHTVVVPNGTAQDGALSWAARGLLVFMLSMPPEWRFREQDLLSRSPMGRDHLRSIVRELEAHHYLRRTQQFDGSRRAAGVLWEVWAMPVEATAGPLDQREDPLSEPSTDFPATENPSAEENKSQTGILPSTDFPSAECEPSTGFPPTENPSAYKNHIEQKPHKPLSPSLRSGDHPPDGGTRENRNDQAANQQQECSALASPELNVAPVASSSASKAPLPAVAPTDTITPSKAASRGLRAAAAETSLLPPFAEPVRELLADWWRLRRKRHRASATPNLSALSIKALHYANDQGVLHQFAEHAAEHGWLSLGFNGHREYINKLVADLAVDADSQRSESCMLRSRSGKHATSRQSAAADRAIAMFSQFDADHSSVASCSPPMPSLTSSPA